jgi:hypothetical protein
MLMRPLLLIPTALVALATSVAAQERPPYPTHAAPLEQPVYQCGQTYTHVPCNGGREVGGKRVTRTFDKNSLPPQDRARKMARAMLPPDTREKCNVLESTIRKEESRLRSKGDAVTEAEEGDLAIQRVHYREMRC